MGASKTLNTQKGDDFEFSLVSSSSLNDKTISLRTFLSMNTHDLDLC